MEDRVDPMLLDEGQHPLGQPPVAVGEAADLPQREEATLDVLHAALDAPLLLRIPGRARRDQEAVAPREVAMDPLHLGVVVAGACDGRRCVVDDQTGRYSTESLERPAVAVPATSGSSGPDRSPRTGGGSRPAPSRTPTSRKSPGCGHPDFADPRMDDMGDH